MSQGTKTDENKPGLATKIIFSLIIISFIIAGVGSYLTPKVNLNPVKVNGRTIQQAELENQFRTERQALERQFGHDFIEKTKDKNFLKKLRKDILERMIGDQALSDYIFKNGIVVSDELVKEYIKQMPEFQIDGKFDQQQYKTVLSRAGFHPNQFGEYLRTDLANDIYVKYILKNQFSLPNEVAINNALLNEERVVTKIDINLDTFSKNVNISDAELQAYYDANKNSYLLPEEVKVSYIFLTSEDLKSEVKYNDADLEKFFNLHSELYITPEKREVAHILLTGDDAEVKAAKALEELKAGAKFEDVVAKYSEDTSTKDTGGKLEAFSLGNQDALFEKAVFALKNVGETTEIVNTQFGSHIIKLLKIIPQTQKDFNVVKNDVIERFVKQESQKIFLDKRQIISDISYENPDSLDATVAAANKREDGTTSDIVKIQKSEFLAKGGKLPEELDNDKVIKAMFNEELREQGTNSDVIDLSPNALVVLHVEEYKAPQPKKLDDIKAEIVNTLQREKSLESCEATAKEVVEAINKGEALDKFVAENKIVVGETKNYTRLTSSVENVEILNNIFELPVAPKGKLSVNSYTNADKVPYILVMSEVKQNTLNNDAQRDAYISNQIVQAKTLQDRDLITKAARENAEIEYNTDRDYAKYIESQDNQSEE